MPIAQRREQLLDAALRVIAARGYAGISIDVIAREAGVTRPVVYGAFQGGAQQLLLRLLDREEQRALRQLTEAIMFAGEKQSIEAYVAAVIPRLVRMVTSDPLTWRTILQAPEGTPSAVRERVDRDRERVRKRFAVLIRSATRHASSRLDPDVASHVALATLEHFGRLLLDDPERVDIHLLVATVSTVLAALRFQPRPQER